MMLAWKAHDDIEFNFCDCQLQNEIDSENEDYIKGKCRKRLEMAGTYVLLIGRDTRYKYKYVRWEAEVAIEKKCRMIAVNLDKWRFMNPATCPPVLREAGALFVPFSPAIIHEAIQSFQPPKPQTHPSYCFVDEVYQRLGYRLAGNTAIMPPKLPPFTGRRI